MKILLAVDGSPCSLAAVDEVGRRPWPAGSEILVVTATLSHDPGLLRAASPTVYDEFVRDQRAASAKELADAVSRLQAGAPQLKVTSMLVEGDPKEAILQQVTNWGADLVVVGSRGFGAVQRMFLGSVSLAVATNAPCSVEIVRCPAEKSAP